MRKSRGMWSSSGVRPRASLERVKVLKRFSSSELGCINITGSVRLKEEGRKSLDISSVWVFEKESRIPDIRCKALGPESDSDECDFER
jgi:hypothetical protein